MSDEEAAGSKAFPREGSEDFFVREAMLTDTNDWMISAADRKWWMRFVGRAISRSKQSRDSEQVESSWWVGKPWRRVEMLVLDSYFNGERSCREFTVSVGLGSRRFGWHMAGSLTRAPGFDYSDEPYQ